MLKILHITLALTSFLVFCTRIVITEIKPERVTGKFLKIFPHLIDTSLLLSGLSLFFMGAWAVGGYTWLPAKISALLLYIVFGVTAMRNRGKLRYLALTGAVISYVYVVFVALSKNPLPYS